MCWETEIGIKRRKIMKEIKEEKQCVDKETLSSGKSCRTAQTNLKLLLFRNTLFMKQEQLRMRRENKIKLLKNKKGNTY